jgi:MFS transporter, SP family, inositol transporter
VVPVSANRAESWKTTLLAGLANYLDAGSIVSGAVALPLWVERYHLSASFVGLLGAFSANAISAAVGALIGGWLCDTFGRKKIYQYDMLFYAFGMSWLVFALQPWMIAVGFVLVGVAVGADIPASWSLIAEMAPPGKRGKHSGVAQILWCLGPIVVLLLSVLLAPFGVLGARIIFGHLGILSLLLLMLRSRMKESQPWVTAKLLQNSQKSLCLNDLFTRRNIGAMAFLVGIYGTANLCAGTYGFFFPYLLHTFGSQTQEFGVAVLAISIMIMIGSIYFVFMRLSDRINQRKMFLASALIQVIGMCLPALFPVTTGLAVLHIFLMSFGGGFGAQSFFQLWSAELFPTLLRATAQGITFAIARISLGLWSFFVPVLLAKDFKTFVWILTGFLAASGLIGLLWAPRHEGKTLGEIETARNRHFNLNQMPTA